VNIEEARAWLDDHINLESLGAPAGAERRSSALALDRVRSLVELLGSPQLSYPAIHLTGTNGKTSVARMTTGLLAEAGLSVGSYTSPHLERVNERLSWNGTPIDDEALAEVLTVVAEVARHLSDPPSYFEILTAAALHWFADVAVDVAIVEVGLGGGRDATNIVDGRVAVVTNVSVDHVEYIGPTIRDIATEKAGIVKPGATLVLGETDPEIAAIFRQHLDADQVVTRDVDFGVRSERLAHGGRIVDLYTPAGRYDEVLIPLHGAHQAQNAAAALAAAEAFANALDPDVVRAAFAAVRSPGRLEVVGHSPLVVLDGAHNVVGAGALRAALAEEFVDAPRIVVVGLLREKEPHEMLEALGVATAARLVCCRAPSPRALEPEALAAAARDLGFDPARIDTVELVAEAVARALALAEPEDQVIVTGSLYTVGAARAALVQ
jgi:dihydrofolate synthase/folylpolyglutamate synthase